MMLEIIEFLDDHSGSLTFIATAVYVVATILICRANIKSAQATKEQVAEAKRQYEEEHRAYITYELIYERRTYYGVRFTNHGRRVASDVQIKFGQEFIDSIEKYYKTELEKLKGKVITLGIGQSYDIYFGENQYRNNPDKRPVEGTVYYEDKQGKYSDSIYIDFEKYATIYSVNSDEEVLIDTLKEQNKALQKIASELEKVNSNMIKAE